MSIDVSIIYLTYRAEPCFDWFADSLARQLTGDIEVVIVDGAWSVERTQRFTAEARGRFRLNHVPAKPSPYAGAHRLTRRDFFAAASARNTGVIYATSPYLVFADDLSVLMPGWWDEVAAAAAAGDVIAGAYQKRQAVEVDNGVLASSRQTTNGTDVRWATGADNRTVPIGGGQLFGCSFGLPRELMLAVNGCDELCDSIGGEDCHLGIRLEWAGAGIRYSRQMLTIESEERHGVGIPAARMDRTLPPSAYIRRLRQFGIGARAVNGNWDSSHMVLDILFGTRSTQTQGNYYLLSALRQDTVHQTIGRFPGSHWFDGRALSEL